LFSSVFPAGFPTLPELSCGFPEAGRPVLQSIRSHFGSNLPVGLGQHAVADPACLTLLCVSLAANMLSRIPLQQQPQPKLPLPLALPCPLPLVPLAMPVLMEPVPLRSLEDGRVACGSGLTWREGGASEHFVFVLHAAPKEAEEEELLALEDAPKAEEAELLALEDAPKAEEAMLHAAAPKAEEAPSAAAPRPETPRPMPSSAPSAAAPRPEAPKAEEAPSAAAPHPKTRPEAPKAEEAPSAAAPQPKTLSLSTKQGYWQRVEVIKEKSMPGKRQRTSELSPPRLMPPPPPPPPLSANPPLPPPCLPRTPAPPQFPPPLELMRKRKALPMACSSSSAVPAAICADGGIGPPPQRRKAMPAPRTPPQMPLHRTAAADADDADSDDWGAWQRKADAAADADSDDWGAWVGDKKQRKAAAADDDSDDWGAWNSERGRWAAADAVSDDWGTRKAAADDDSDDWGAWTTSTQRHAAADDLPPQSAADDDWSWPAPWYDVAS
jgi:hypothetical protein